MLRLFRRAAPAGALALALFAGGVASPAHAGVWELCAKAQRSTARLSGSMNKLVVAVEGAIKDKDHSDKREEEVGKLASDAYPDLLDAADVIEAENQKADLGDLTSQAADLVAVIRKLAGTLAGGDFGYVAPVITEYNTTADAFFASCDVAAQNIPRGGGAPQDSSADGGN